jgi:UDP-3-O-[3-hydroxymyristoyl] glucosamine N-acyltransferase
MNRSVDELAAFLQCQLKGDGSLEIAGLSNIESASHRDLVFVEDEEHLQTALGSQAAAVIAGEFADQRTSPKTLLICKQPRLAFAQAGVFLYPPPQIESGVHETAIVHSAARLDADVIIEARAVISEDVAIGAGTRIGAGVVIGAGVRIGIHCEIYPNVTIYPGVQIGDRVIVHAGAVLGSDGFGYVRDKASGRYTKFPQIGRLIIEDKVEIGANTTIDRGALETTLIGRGTKIDNLVHIGHNCQIGEDVVIAAQAGFSGSIIVENNVVLGGQVGIGEHARLTEGVMLGGQGGVLPHKVLRGKGVAFWGTPAQPLRQYLKQLAALARLAKKR